MCRTLTSTIQQLAERIKERRYQSEAAISQGVVQRILSKLGWPQYDTQIFAPQFKIGDSTRKVDYALCDPPGKAIILVEVKDLGKADRKGQQQLFEYAFHQGVPIVVLTDGRIWSFFYPPGQGDCQERQFAKIDLLSDDSFAAASRLSRYLKMEDAKSQMTRKHAEEDYEKERLKRQATLEFQSVWNKFLLEPATSLMFNSFLEEVKKATVGSLPDSEQAIEFIRRQAMGRTMSTISDAHNTAAVREITISPLSPTSSSPIPIDWVKLSEWDPPLKTLPPERIKFPGGTEKPVRRWKHILIYTGEWLNSTDKFNTVSIPIFSGPSERVLDTDPSEFRSSTQISETGLFLNSSGDAKNIRKKTISLLKECNVNPSDILLKTKE